MRIAYLTDALFPLQMGGMAKYARFHMETLRERDALIDVFASAPASGHPEIAGVQWISWPGSAAFPGHYVRENRRFSEEIGARLADGTYDVIFAHGLTAMSLKEPKCPLIVHPHGLESFQLGSGILSRLQLLPLRRAFTQLLLRADGIVSFGEFFDRILVQEIGVRAEVLLRLGNAVSPAFLSPVSGSSDRGIPRSTFRFLFVGRDEPRKGLDLFLRAAIKIPTAEFCVVGHHPVQEKSSLRNVRFLGEIREERALRSVYSQVDALVLPSRAEGFPTVVLEGMASALTIVAARVGVIPDLAQQAQVFTFEKDDLTGLIESLEKVSQMSAGDRQAIGEKNRSLVLAKYCWDRVADDTLNGIQELVKRARP
ncbi:MAG TPA: glycosyltransferase family 4 protein [Bdellovibrionota bacterium]|nr:glycosyltransferase family 4 protein [Bdellovibrionota bacterium]